MSAPIEDYALIGNCRSAALVGKKGNIDWLCLPHFDSGACFAALLGDERHGHWSIHPMGEFELSRRYIGHSLVLETTFHTATGIVRLIDWMSMATSRPTLCRELSCLAGEVSVVNEIVLRFDYGSIVPWLTLQDGCLVATAGPDRVLLRDSFQPSDQPPSTRSEFTMVAGERKSQTMVWQHSHLEPAAPDLHIGDDFHHCLAWWQAWISQSTYDGPYKDVILRSLITLKSLSFEPTGGIVAAPTTSLPESLGGARNWDYRFAWVRDSTFALYALLSTGFLDEARAWRQWLVRAVAGTPSQVNIMYGLAGERRLPEIELPWLPGYENSRPVRVGNAACEQRQLDIYGELLDTLHLARRSGLDGSEPSWNIQKEAINFLQKAWQEPDEGIWEVRGGRQHFVHSKVMAWVAVDRAIKAIEGYGKGGPVEQWRQLRADIHHTVLERGFDAQLNSFTQAFGTCNVDASLLMLPLVGFLPADDYRIRGTVARIEKELMHKGLLLRYHVNQTKDGLVGSEGCFLACSFWLVDNYVLQNEYDKAWALFEHLLSLQNDVGLLAEEYDVDRKRLVGNFPQALSHIALVNSAVNLWRGHLGSAADRSRHQSRHGTVVRSP